MTDFLDQWAQASQANARLVAQETLIIEVTEALWAVLERTGVSKSELAERLGISKSHVSQVLSGSRNMTLRMLADMCFVLGATPRVDLGLEPDEEWQFEHEEPLLPELFGPHVRLLSDDGATVLTPGRMYRLQAKPST
ncbi:MAG: helix-turn-helix domain-containing protein [Xanthomonadales bacterium]|nr:helix-turn-helix domain-containing protein [Xanthomonadales bacterium]